MHVRIVIATLAGAVLALGCGSTSNNGDGGSTNSTPARLSAAGESCARTADCAADLVCMSQQCVTAGTTGTDGGAPATVRASARGEECTTTADCTTGLVCWPVSNGSVLFTGMCDYANFGVTPTGKTCSAECTTAADCLEIPLQDQAGPPVYKSCEDVAAAIPNGTDCGTTATKARECFLRATYCNTGGTNPWACTSGQCVFNGTCVAGKGAEVFGGCPAYTRSGTGLAVTTCNATTLKCTAAATTGCTTDVSCTGKPVADDGTDTCSDGECVCHVASGGCYRRCRNDLECAHGYVCGTSQYCVAAPSCDSDAVCVTSTKFTNAKCVQGACQLPCANDLECNFPAYFINGSPAQVNLVCHAGTCQEIGCSSNTECSKTVSGKTVNMFCATPPDAAATAAPVSAITN